MSDPTTPQLSVIVPTCRRSDSLKECLAALGAQSLAAARFEVIVVDDSGDAPPTRIEPPGAALFRFEVLRHDRNRGAAAARNSGARSARGSYLAFVDDDCVPDAEWAAEIVRQLPRSAGAALVGTVQVDDPQPCRDRVTQLLSDPLHAADGSLLRAQTANLTVPAADFTSIGGFDETYRGAGYEDYEFCERWRAGGRRIVAVPQAIVHHRRSSTISGFWRQHYRYGRGAARFYGGGPDGHRPPLGASLQRMWQAVAAGRSVPERLRHLGWVGLSQCAMLAGFTAGKLAGS